MLMTSHTRILLMAPLLTVMLPRLRAAAKTEEEEDQVIGPVV
jgi:hypothetical protein